VRCLRNRWRGGKRGSSDAQNQPSELATLAGHALMTNLVVSMAGEAYAADEQLVQIENPS
jgi:hypothetical protein